VARLDEGLTKVQRRLPASVQRAGFRVAYRVAQVGWYVLRPDVHGVKGILLDGDRVLLVRHTYGDRGRWDVPGGHAHSGEPAVEAVAREMHEELGLRAAWEHVGSIGARSDHKVERVHCFVAPRPAGVEIELARGEIAEAQWFDLGALTAPLGELSLRTLALLGHADGGRTGAGMRAR
jgi:8-oxo-dGTP pyrophosphatase MutT (NUDIX family)